MTNETELSSEAVLLHSDNLFDFLQRRYILGCRHTEQQKHKGSTGKSADTEQHRSPADYF